MNKLSILFLITASFILAAEGCRQIPAQSETQNTGLPVPIQQEKNFGSVRIIDEQGGLVCSGTILSSKDTTLTAAHCIIDMISKPESLRIEVGNKRYVKVKKILIHPEFENLWRKDVNDWTFVDVAIIFHEKSEENRSYSRISYNGLESGDEVTVSGFGFWSHDFDADGVSNPRDYCSTTPADKVSLIERKGPRTGCASNETPNLVFTPSPEWDIGILRRGQNRVIKVFPKGESSPFLYAMSGNAIDNKDNSATVHTNGDSGGSLYDKDGNLAGVLSSAFSKFDENRKTAIVTGIAAALSLDSTKQFLLSNLPTHEK